MEPVLNRDSNEILRGATERVYSYDQTHCWQHDIRLNNLQVDVEEAPLSKEEISFLSVSDFTFAAYARRVLINIGTDEEPIWVIDAEESRLLKRESSKEFAEVKRFIERHEWLGTMSYHPTNFFTAKYAGILAGAVVMDMPTAFSKILGPQTRQIERLISRGACISWSPKNLASALIMHSIQWMVENTPYRLFTAYSDPEACELGAIYQACNFAYLGQTAGATKKYKLKNGKWSTDRNFRSRSAYKRYAQNLGIQWQNGWQKGDSILWNKVPEDVANRLKQASKDAMNQCEVRPLPPKHKYAYILGADGRETRMLKKLFAEHSPRLQNLLYPKLRCK